MRKYSKQRELIYDYLKNTTSHPTAEKIFTDLKEENPSLGLATVYRNLNLLKEDGLVLKLDVGQSVDHYDADTSTHHHFVCTTCHKVSDVSLPIESRSWESALQGIGSVSAYRLFLMGECDECKKKQTAVS